MRQLPQGPPAASGERGVLPPVLIHRVVLSTFKFLSAWSQGLNTVHRLVLVTGDQNMRLKARFHDIPTRDVPAFMKLVARL
jgi:hypothetical protein